MTSLRLLAVLNVPSSTPPRAKRLAPRPDGLLTHFASPRGEKCRLAVRTIKSAAIAASYGLLLSCGGKDVAPPPPTPAVAAPLPEPPRVSSVPVSEPQTVAKLPPPQPIPPEAIPDGPAPLAVDPPRRAADLQTAEEDVAVPSGASVPAAELVSPPSPTAGGLRLGRILTAEERESYNEAIDQSLAAAHRSMAVVLRHDPQPQQTEEVKRVRAFIRQAETARKEDLPLAKNLAERASLLAQDLARSVE